MKMSEKDKPIRTIPDGVWESSNPSRGCKQHRPASTDAQGNGYPTQKQETMTDIQNPYGDGDIPEIDLP